MLQYYHIFPGLYMFCYEKPCICPCRIQLHCCLSHAQRHHSDSTVCITVKFSVFFTKFISVVSFAGGKADATDTNLSHTALREADEEIGLCSEKVDVWGEMLPVPGKVRKCSEFAEGRSFQDRRTALVNSYLYGPFLLKLLVTVKIMYKKKVFQMCNKCCQGCSGEH